MTRLRVFCATHRIQMVEAKERIDHALGIDLFVEPCPECMKEAGAGAVSATIGEALNSGDGTYKP